MTSEEMADHFLEAVLYDLRETKEMNRVLRQENIDLKIENAQLNKELEMYECFMQKGERR